MIFKLKRLKLNCIEGQETIIYPDFFYGRNPDPQDMVKFYEHEIKNLKETICNNNANLMYRLCEFQRMYLESNIKIDEFSRYPLFKRIWLAIKGEIE